jgi:hypothetical protein
VTTPQNPYQTPQGGQAPQNPYGAPNAGIPPQGYPNQAAPNQGVPPQGFPAPPAAGYPAPPAPAKSVARRGARSLGIRVVGALVALVVVGGGAWVYDHLNHGADTAKAGDCMHNNGTKSDPDMHVVSCSDSGAEFKVIQTFSGDDSSQCQNVQGATEVYYQSGGQGTSAVTLCLGPVSGS